MPSIASRPLASSYDSQRFVTVYHRDANGVVPAAFNPHATLREVAHALCDNEIADCPVVCIVEAYPGDGRSSYVTEDVARLIPAIAEEAYRDGWRVRACALDLAARFEIEIDALAADEIDDEGDRQQISMDNERHRLAMGAF